MCVECVVFHLGVPPLRVENRGELASAMRMPLTELPVQGGADLGEGPENCLCNVDMERLAWRIGWHLDQPDWSDETDHFDAWALREPEAANRGGEQWLI